MNLSCRGHPFFRGSPLRRPFTSFAPASEHRRSWKWRIMSKHQTNRVLSLLNNDESSWSYCKSSWKSESDNQIWAVYKGNFWTTVCIIRQVYVVKPHMYIYVMSSESTFITYMTYAANDIIPAPRPRRLLDYFIEPWWLRGRRRARFRPTIGAGALGNAPDSADNQGLET